MGEKKVKSGVVITQREMYDLIQEVSRSLHRMESKLENLEEKIEDVVEADERSREALNTANEALEIAKETKNQLDWFWKTVVSGVILAVISALFILAGIPIGG
ncbi:hemolysin XhlA family protein [Thermoactinomyces sp. CICC 23799]|uniref:hemolysin XhlA family protein n=1 Tax=Thermoactinomyces sp. CICC 23799 TaxID=2767429 RepID=UPI0018DB5FE1|nr:hemolysin XhlA family protein [Thermoactinomyces sp. CICC 23799]